MKETITLALAFAAGIAVGLFFFGGLWWTVQKATKSSRPAWLFLLNYILRLAAVGMVVFIFRNHWKWLVTGLVGFIAARGFLFQWLSRNQKNEQKGKIVHAHQP